MAYAANVNFTAPAYPSVDGLNPAAPTRYVARHQPEPRQLSTFHFNGQRIFALDGGKLLLRLYRPPTLLVDRETRTFEIENWGIRMPLVEVADVPRKIGRRFLELFSKAELQTWDTDEEEAWLRVLDQVDYRQFYVDRAAPRYEEATLVRKTPVCLVDWADGEREKLSPTAAASLHLLDRGDRFGAFVKFDRNNKAQSIERILLLETDVPEMPEPAL